MKLKFENCYRAFLLILACILFWGIWAGAQEQPTNVVAKVETTNATSSAIIQLPGVLQERSALLTFGLDRIEALQPELAGNPRWKYVASFLYIVLAFYISKFLDFLTRVWLKKLASRTSSRLDDLLLDLLNGPVKIISFVIFLHIGLSVFSWPPMVQEFFSKGLNLIVVAAFVYVLLKAIDLAFGYWKARSEGQEAAFNAQLFPIMRKSLKVFVIVVAFLFVCDNVFQYDIKTILASLSIGGLALGLAAQDTLSNFFGAVVVFVDKPFRVGDRIKLPELDGVVESIGMRSTRVRNLDGHLITVPNKTMGNAMITNITARPNIKTVMNIGVTYDTPTEKVNRALAILRETYQTHPMTGDVWVAFDKFADSSLNILVIHWWKTTDYKAYLAGMQEMNLKIKGQFDAEGISFAFPSRTVYLKQDSDWKFGSENQTKTT